jgi:hypothetical protein
VFLHAITDVCAPVCLFTAITSVEAVTPPKWTAIIFTLPASEVNRQHIDAGDGVGDSGARILHPLGREVIQTFWLPVSLIRGARMAKLVHRLIASDCRPLLEGSLIRRACLGGRCCRETMA